jgi:hypothetical protein
MRSTAGLSVTRSSSRPNLSRITDASDGSGQPAALPHVEETTMKRIAFAVPTLAIAFILGACQDAATPVTPSTHPVFALEGSDWHCRTPADAAVPPVVEGNVIVHPGAFCIALDSRIKGNVIVLPDAIGYHQHRGRTEGNIQADFPVLDIRVLDVEFVGGDIQINRTRPGTAGGICRSQINGSIQLKQNQGTVDIGIGFPFDVCTGGNTINGDIKVEESGPGAVHRINMNQVNGNLQYFKNTGATGTILNNQIKGNLQCKENVPPPVSAGNTAQSKEGQCLL